MLLKNREKKLNLRAFFPPRTPKIFRTLVQKILSFYIESSQKEQCERAREQMSENQLILIVMLIIYFPSTIRQFMNARDEYNHMWNKHTNKLRSAFFFCCIVSSQASYSYQFRFFFSFVFNPWNCFMPIPRIPLVRSIRE